MVRLEADGEILEQNGEAKAETKAVSIKFSNLEFHLQVFCPGVALRCQLLMCVLPLSGWARSRDACAVGKGGRSRGRIRWPGICRHSRCAMFGTDASYQDGVIVGGMEADPSCVSVRMHRYWHPRLPCVASSWRCACFCCHFSPSSQLACHGTVSAYMLATQRTDTKRAATSGAMQHVKPSALTFLPPSHLKVAPNVRALGDARH